MKILKFLLKTALIFGTYWYIFKNENPIIDIVVYAIVGFIILSTGGIRLEKH